MLAPDRFMGNYRTTVNIIGYAVAAFIIARWENLLDLQKPMMCLTEKLRISPKMLKFLSLSIPAANEKAF